MFTRLMFWFGLMLLAASDCLAAQDAVKPAGPLVWNFPDQTNHAAASDVTAHFTFAVSNASAMEIVIDDVKASCGCTVAKPPVKPWPLRPGETNLLKVLVDLRGKNGRLFKDIEIVSATDPTTLHINVEIEPGTNKMSKDTSLRMWGDELAGADRQAVFTNPECLKCHLVPAFGKSGENLFHTTCGICHESPRRATMVPDLGALKTAIDANYWRSWVTYGKPGTLMPAFASTERGPLTDAQIDSLVAYLTKAFPRPITQ